VNYEERLDNMVASGAISSEQAKELKTSSIGASSNHSSLVNKSARKPLPIGLILFATFTILLLSAILFIGGSTTDATQIVQDVSQTINQAGEVGNMNKSLQSSLFFGSIILVPIFLILMIFMFTYNSLISNEEEVLNSWARVESNIQRRADLIPNLVSTVKTFMEHESQVFDEVSENRAGGLSEVVSALEDLESNTTLSKVTKENLADEHFMKALATEQSQLGQRINKLMGVVEDYPTLASADNFMSLQAQLEGTENRINIARIVFNEAVRDYNSSIRKIPGSLVASISGFKRKAYFQSDAEGTASDVHF